VTAASAQIGGGGSLSGSSQYVDIANAGLGITGDLTIQAWVKPTDFNWWSGILTKGYNNLAAPYDYYLYYSTGKPFSGEVTALSTPMPMANSALRWVPGQPSRSP